MKTLRKLVWVAVAGALLAACSTNGTSIGPSVTQANLGNDRLQLAVGTENDGNDGVVNLDVVATYRQPNGLSAVLLDTPTITGPAGFVVPAGAPAVDAGTNHISGSPQVLPNQTPTPTTFSNSGGVFSYGFGPFNSDNSGDPFYPGNPPLYAQPFYSSNGGVNVVGGPPAYPFFNDGTYPPGFEGYSQGFSAFEATPVAGTYTLSVNVPIVGTSGHNATASANLTTTTPLGLPAVGAITEDGAGGLSTTVTVTDASVLETLVYVQDTTSGLMFTIGPFAGTGTFPAVLPPNLGACTSPGCENGSNATPSICFATAPTTICPNGADNYIIFAVSYNWPMFESSPPKNRQIAPTITGANGQADVAISAFTPHTYSRPFAHPHVSLRLQRHHP